MILRRSAVVILEPARLEAQYVSPVGQFVEVGGMRLRVRIHGREDSPKELLEAICSLLTPNALISAR